MSMAKILFLMDMPLFPYRIYAYNGLSERGYDLTVVSISNTEAKYNIPLKFKHIRLSFIKVSAFRWIKGCSSIKYSDYDYIIVTPNLRVLNFYPLFRKKYREKVLVWGHMKGYTSDNKFAAKVRMSFCKTVKAIIFYESESRNEYIKKGYDLEKLFVANNTQYVEPSLVVLGKEKKYFLYVGRIQERKGLDVAINAFVYFRNKYPQSDTRFKIVGGGNNTNLLLLAKDKNIDGFVDFVGSVYEEKNLSELFSQAYAYVSPGHVGLGLLHSFAFGVPVITCTDRLHSAEITNCKPENSLLVPYTDKDVAEAMIKLYSNKVLQTKMSEAAYKYYNECCSIDKMIDGIDHAIKYVEQQ